MPKTLTSPNDSLQQSTREPSTRSGDRTSLDASRSTTNRFLSSNSQMGGGSYTSYLKEHLARMHSDIEATTRKLELEQRRLYNLDKLLSTAETEWDGKREKYKLFTTAVDSAVSQKNVKVRRLERKLVKAIEDLNKGNCDNEQLREQIDQLRKERTILDSVFKTMQKDINGKTKLLKDEKEKMNESRFSSEEAKQRVKALNKMLERERRAFKEETKNMQKELHEQSEVQKEQDNLNRFTRSDSNSKAPKGKQRARYMVADEEEAFSEPVMHRRILKLSFLNTIQRRHIKQHQKNIEVFEQAFATIKSSTGISDIKEIVGIFVLLEERNFSLLTYVNTLNREIETIEIRNRELKNQLETQKQEQTNSAARKKVALNEISIQIQNTNAATEEKDKMVSDSASALIDCRPLIWNIVRHLKETMPVLLEKGYEGDPPPMKAAAPDEHEENLNNHLMYIEESILQFRKCLSEEAQQLAKAEPKPPPKVNKKVEPMVKLSDLPEARIPKPGEPDEDSDDEDKTNVPWTRAELREKAEAMIQRRKRKHHGKLMGEDKRAETFDETAVTGEAARGAPPPREYAASSIASKESKENDSVGGAALSKSPSMFGKQTSSDGVAASEEARCDRPEMMFDWRGKGKEKGR